MLGTGQMACWGATPGSAQGPGSFRSRPALVPGLTGVVTAACGYRHACALLGSGALYCWGHNINGEVGDGTRVERTTPALVPGGSYIQVDATNGTTCALRSDQTAWCWGSNAWGRLASPIGSADAFSPRRVAGLP